MIIPVRCFTCNKTIGHLWEKYNIKLHNYLSNDFKECVARDMALNDVGIPPEKYCCRRMLLSHIDVIDSLLLYSNNPGEMTCAKHDIQ